MSIDLIAKIAPKNDGFVGMVDGDQIISPITGIEIEIETRTTDPTSPPDGRIWLRTNL